MFKRIFFIAFTITIGLTSCSKDDSPNGTTENDFSANLQPTGSSSRDLLSDVKFKSMILEVVYVDGFAPTQSTINNLVSFIEARTFKPDGITIEMRSIPSPGLSPYTTNEISDIETANRTRYNTSNRIAVWAFFADGESSSDTNNSVILGTAYRNTSFVIYEETLRRFSNGTTGPSRTVLETTTIHHEFGHILGLTNLGAPLQSDHEDDSSPKHCDVETCLMYFEAETGDIMNMVSGGIIPQLDSQCIADLRANGGR